MPAHHYTVREIADKYGVTTHTILRLVKERSVDTIMVDGVLRVWDKWEDPKTGTNSAEDVHILRGAEVAEILGITTRNLRYLVTGGKISCVFVGLQRRYCLADVRRLLARRMEAKGFSSHRGPRVRTAIVQWALERLASMDLIKRQAKNYHEGSQKSSWGDPKVMAKRKERSNAT